MGCRWLLSLVGSKAVLLILFCCSLIALPLAALQLLFLPLSSAVLMARLLGGTWEHKKKGPVALSVAEEIQALAVLFVGGGVLLP